MLVTDPLVVSTEIGPVVPPVGEFTVMLVPPAFTEAPVAEVPLKLTVGPVPKLVPVMVTAVPAAPLAGLKPVIVGMGPPEVVTVTFKTKSSILQLAVPAPALPAPS